MTSKGSTNGLGANIPDVIERVENEEVDSAKANGLETNQNDEEPQPEEYESLVFGESIWSTDVPKESRRQFLKNVTNLAVTPEVENVNEVTNDEDDFAAIQKKIQETTIP